MGSDRGGKSVFFHFIGKGNLAEIFFCEKQCDQRCCDRDDQRFADIDQRCDPVDMKIHYVSSFPVFLTVSESFNT